MNASYFIFADQQYGPFGVSALEELKRQGRFASETFVFCEGETTEWTAAGQVLSLKSLFEKVAHGTPPSSGGSLAERLRAARLNEVESEGGTMLVAPSKEGRRAVEAGLPHAPLSDLARPSPDGAWAPAPTPRRGFWQRVKRLLRLSQAGDV